MPQINLLPTVPGKKKKAKSLEIPKVELTRVTSVFLPISYIVIAILVFVWLIFSFFVLKDKKELAALDKKTGNFSVSPQEIQKINLKKEQLKSKVALLEALSSRKFLWAGKLESIAEFVPEGIWLTEVSLDILIMPSSNTSKEKENKQDRYMLTIKGSAFAYKIQDAVSNIGKFNNLLKENESFFKDFVAVELNNVAKATIGKTDIMNFEFDLSIR